MKNCEKGNKKIKSKKLKNKQNNKNNNVNLKANIHVDFSVLANFIRPCNYFTKSDSSFSEVLFPNYCLR